MLFKKYRINKLKANIFVYEQLEIESRRYVEGVPKTNAYFVDEHLNYLRKLLEFKAELAILEGK